jgi:hypothetical protein
MKSRSLVFSCVSLRGLVNRSNDLFGPSISIDRIKSVICVNKLLHVRNGSFLNLCYGYYLGAN